MQIIKFFITLSLMSLVCCAVKQPDAKCLTDFNKAILKAHNSLRAQHQAGNLKENKATIAIAQAYAKVLADAAKFEHSHRPGYGENLFASYSTVDSLGDCATFAQNCVQQWYNEIKDYNFKKGEFGMNTGHFTQVVWKSTTELGCGVYNGVVKKNGINFNASYCVCNYQKPGNYIGEFFQNVLPKK